MENDEEMTREIALHCMKSASELKSELCEECPIYGQTGCDHCFEDALQYVIGMLDQEPCEDCISRQAVLAIAGDSCLDLDSYEDTKDFCDEINELPPVTPQEQYKPMVEIDLYTVIKQKYIEREVLDKIRAEIEEVNTYDGVYIDRAYVLEILDKYKAESEDKENE